jgi:hypothetical protein
VGDEKGAVGETREPEALFAYVVSVATNVLNERRSPYEGAKDLWRLSSAMWELPEALLTFVGLASAWEDCTGERTQREREIVLEMERLRRRFSA